MQEVNLGQYALPVLITVIMGVIYKFFEKPDGTSSLSDKWKTLIVIIVGIGLGEIALLYKGLEWTVVNLVDYTLYGFMSGCAAIGIWKGLGAVNVK